MGRSSTYFYYQRKSKITDSRNQGRSKKKLRAERAAKARAQRTQPQRVVPAPPSRKKKVTPQPAPAPQRAVIGNKTSSGNNSLAGYWKGEKATELTRFIDIMFQENGTGKREGKLFQWNLEDNKKLTINWLELIASSKYIKVMNDAESMQTVSKQVKVYVVDGKNITIVELNDKYYEVISKDIYDVIELNNTSLKLSFKTARGQTIQMLHTKQ